MNLSAYHLQVGRALALDYVVPPAERQLTQLERPLDRYLQPLATALALRTSLTQEPEGAEEEAVLLIERSKESRNPAIKRDLLARAVDKLSSLPLVQPPGKEYAGADRPTLQLACRRRTVVWGDLIRSAWGGGRVGSAGAGARMEDIVRTAAPYCLAARWSPDVDREMVVLQVRRLGGMLGGWWFPLLVAWMCAAVLFSRRGWECQASAHIFPPSYVDMPARWAGAGQFRCMCVCGGGREVGRAAQAHINLSPPFAPTSEAGYQQTQHNRCSTNQPTAVRGVVHGS